MGCEDFRCRIAVHGNMSSLGEVTKTEDEAAALQPLTQLHAQWRKAASCGHMRLHSIRYRFPEFSPSRKASDVGGLFPELSSPQWVSGEPSLAHASAVNEGERMVRKELHKMSWRKLRRNLSPHFRASFDASVASSNAGSPGIGSNSSAGAHVAMLISGGVRTWVHREAVRDWQESLAQLKAYGIKVEAFAFLDLEDSLRHHVNRVSEIKARHAHVTRSHVEEVLSRLGFLTWELEIQTNGTHYPLSPDMRAACPEHSASADGWTSFLRRGTPLQFAKVRRRASSRTATAKIRSDRLSTMWQVEAATNMMQQAEQRRGIQFTVVIRVRPDLCLRPSVPLIQFAVRRLGVEQQEHPLPIAFSVADGLAVYGRWAASAYASVWRGDGDCLMPELWAHPNAVLASAEGTPEHDRVSSTQIGHGQSFAGCVGATGQSLQWLVEHLHPPHVSSGDEYDPVYDLLPVQNFMLWGALLVNILT